MEKERVKLLYNRALDWIYYEVGFDDEEYLRICKEYLKMTKEELEEEKINMGYEEGEE